MGDRELTRSRIDYWSGGGGGGGAAANGLPVGGTTGQVLAKDSGADYDASWQDATAGGIRKYVYSFNFTAGTTYTVTHNLNSLAVVVDIYNTATGATLYTDIVRTTPNDLSVTVTNAEPPTGNLTAVVIG